MEKFLFYLARALTMAIAVFFAFFLTEATLPAFREEYTIILTLFVFGIGLTAWFIPMMGGVLLVLFGLRYFVMIAQPGDLTPALLVLGVFLITGALFIWEGYRTGRGNRPTPRKYWFP